MDEDYLTIKIDFSPKKEASEFEYKSNSHITGLKNIDNLNTIPHIFIDSSIDENFKPKPSHEFCEVDDDILTFEVEPSSHLEDNISISSLKLFDSFNDECDADNFLSGTSYCRSNDLMHKGPSPQNTKILNSVLSHRPLCQNISRMKAISAVSTCSNILRHSASMPNTRLVAQSTRSKNFRVLATSHSSNAHQRSERKVSDSSKLKLSQSFIHRVEKNCTSCSGTYPALEDHRYYAKCKRSESPPPQKRKISHHISPQFKSSSFPISNPPITQISNSNSTSNHSLQANKSTRMSILETFLRATCPLDPSKGSNAALATKGFSNLFIEEPLVPSIKSPSPSTGYDNNLLKKLLTGEIHEDEIYKKQVSSDCSVSSEESPIVSPSSYSSESPNFGVDSILTDGFGLDADLTVDEKGSLNIDNSSSEWQLELPKMVSQELLDCLLQQDVQDMSYFHHYITDRL